MLVVVLVVMVMIYRENNKLFIKQKLKLDIGRSEDVLMNLKSCLF